MPATPIYDDAWDLAQLPHQPPQKMHGWGVSGATYFEQYNERYLYYVEIGWTFSDLLGTGLGSTARLTANGYFDESGGTVPTEHWHASGDSGGWLPYPQERDYYSDLTAQLEGTSFFFDRTDIDTYPGAMATPGFILSNERQYKYGLGVRATFRLMQLKCAFFLSNVCGLDGGPFE